MALRSLHSLFRRLDISTKNSLTVSSIISAGPITPRYYTDYQNQRNTSADYIYKPSGISTLETPPQSRIVTFSPRSISLDVDLPSSNAVIRNIIEFPVLSNLQIIEPPNKLNIEKDDIPLEKSLELPPTGRIIEKQAARLIVIRRHKMRKHKLRKLRKRMKFTWAKIRQKRELRKEKAFRAMLNAQMNEAEKFDAKEYVAEKIRKATEVHMSTSFQGKDIPLNILQEMLQQKKERKQKMAEKRARDLKRKEIKL